MLRSPVTHALFDLDGVLLDTERLYTEATQAVVGRYGKVYDWSVKHHTMGRDPKLGAQDMLARLGIPMTPEEFLATRRPLLECIMRDAVPMKGAEAFVRSVAARGIPMAVATSSERDLFELKTRRHEWFALFRAVVCGDDDRILRLKPAPDIFLLAAQELGAPAHTCVVFEDSPAGVQAAKAAGMQAVALVDPALDRGLFEAADVIIGNFYEMTPKDFAW